MIIDNVQRSMPLIASQAHNSMGAAHIRLKYLAAKLGAGDVKLSYWQLIFLQSRVNGCCYKADDLPLANWRWPQDTWFQGRLNRYLSDLREPRCTVKMNLLFDEASC